MVQELLQFPLTNAADSAWLTLRMGGRLQAPPSLVVSLLAKQAGGACDEQNLLLGRWLLAQITQVYVVSRITFTNAITPALRKRLRSALKQLSIPLQRGVIVEPLLDPSSPAPTLTCVLQSCECARAEVDKFTPELLLEFIRISGQETALMRYLLDQPNQAEPLRVDQ